ncbi:MAG: glycosyltransferase family 39 protein [Candidatus Omnitrophica bacterium]|nr:glycosyltransferase family 39 protein [Candidatus Omnitrophota bacterium]
MTTRKKEVTALFIMGALYLALMINNFIWLKIDATPFTYDAHRHFMFSLRVFREYRHFSLASLGNIIEMTQRHPPFVAIVTAPFYFISGISQDAGALVNSAVFLAVLLFSIYGIGKRVAGIRAGLLSAFIAAMYPAIFNHMKTYNLDLPLTAMCALSVWALLSSEGLTSRRYTLLFGLSSGLAFLTKDSFPLFIAAPLAITAARGISRSRISWKVIMPGLLLAVSLPLFYYLPKHSIALSKLNFFAPLTYNTFFQSQSHTAGLLSSAWHALGALKSFFWYILGMMNFQVSFFFFVVLLLGAGILRKKRRASMVFLTASSLFPLIAVSYLRRAPGPHMIWMGVRLTMPLLPLLAVVSGAGILSIRGSGIRRSLVFAIIIFGVFQSVVVSYGAPLLPLEVSLPLRAEADDPGQFVPERIILFKQRMPAYGGPLSYPNAEIPERISVPGEIYRIIDSSNTENKPLYITVIPDISRIWARLEYESFIRERPYTIIGDWQYFSGSYTEADKKMFLFADRLLKADYVIHKVSGEIGEDNVRAQVMALTEVFRWHKDKYELIQTLKWPDNSDIYIYKKK